MTDIISNLPDEPAAVVPPTRRQLMMLASDMGMASIDEAVMKFALAALALWGCPAAPHPAPVAWCRSDDFLAAEAKRQSFSGWREQHRDCDMALYITKPPAPEIPEEIRLAFAEPERKEKSLRDFRALCTELLNELHGYASANPHHDSDALVARARAALAAPPAPAVGPVPVSERLPEPDVKVLAHYVNDLGKGRTVCAIWVPAKTRSDSDGDYDFTEYDEEDDTFYWPEGWYEAIENCDDWDWVKVDEGEVVYWQPLPKWPAHALPLPSGEVEG